jgi:surface polysaccharide O-acyltransferase-like enzyme
MLRGLAIIGVVAIHNTGIGYVFKDTSLDFNITVFWRQILNFSVPMFIAISGFFFANKDTSTPEKYFLFLKKQIPKVLIPYLIWSILYIGVAFMRGATFESLIYRLFTFQTSVQFYFIILIIEYYLLLPVLQKLASTKGLILSAFISVLSCLIIFYLRYYTEINLPIYIVGAAPSWLIFFVLGLYMRNNEIILENYKISIFIILGLVLSVLETYVLYHKFGSIQDSITTVKISSFIYSYFVVLFAFKNVDKHYNKTKLLVYIGSNCNYGVFCPI